MGVAMKRVDVEGVVPSAEELLERARAMVPTLKARAKACTRARNVPAETIAEMKEAGFFRILQPANFGGYEMHPNAFFEVQKVLAEGCMSTAWIYGVMGVHPWQLARYPIETQREVWGEDHSALICSPWRSATTPRHTAPRSASAAQPILEKPFIRKPSDKSGQGSPHAEGRSIRNGRFGLRLWSQSDGVGRQSQRERLNRRYRPKQASATPAIRMG